MDFKLTEEQRQIKEDVREFAQKELAPKARELDKNPRFQRELYRRIAELGIIGSIIPKDYGGTELGHLARMLANIEVSKACPSMGLACQTVPIGLWALLHFGTEEQKKKYIPEVVKGSKVACLATTEPTGGSDLANIATTAKKVNDDYIINGSKVLITLAPESDFCMFTAKTGEGSKGISMFIAEKGTAGLCQGPVDEREGLRAAMVGGLSFKDMKLSKDNLVGKEGDGLKIALKGIIEVGRTGNCALAIGIAETVYEKTLTFVKERKLYGGKPLAGLQAIQFNLGEMYTEIEASKLLAYQAAWLLDQGKTSLEVGREISAAKIYTSETAKKAALKATSMLGGYSTLPGFDIIRCLRDALETDASAGSNNVCRMVLGRELTGILTLGG